MGPQTVKELNGATYLHDDVWILHFWLFTRIQIKTILFSLLPYGRTNSGDFVNFVGIVKYSRELRKSTEHRQEGVADKSLRPPG